MKKKDCICNSPFILVFFPPLSFDCLLVWWAYCFLGFYTSFTYILPFFYLNFWKGKTIEPASYIWISIFMLFIYWLKKFGIGCEITSVFGVRTFFFFFRKKKIFMLGNFYWTVRMLREELQLLQEPGSYVGEVVKVMGKSKVLVKVRKSILFKPLNKDGAFVPHMFYLFTYFSFWFYHYIW